MYSAESGIPPDGRAKAQIEVVSIDNKSAECRVIHNAAHEVILGGDLIANPIYDRNRAVSFVIAGDFDLDHDGAPDQNGALRIESMIADWGGTLSTDLSGLTDFVVVGAAPQRPRPVAERSAAQAQRAERMQQAYDRYGGIVEAARTLAVPTLTQEVFLNFLGYSRR